MAADASVAAAPPRARPAERSGWARFPVWLPGALLTLIAGAIDISHPELWRDEVASWAAAHISLGHLFHLLHHTDAVTGPYYVGLHLWIKVFGDSALSMRLPSLLAMAVAAGCTSGIGVRIGDRRLGVVAGVLFAAIPTVSRYAQEARVYAVVVAAFAAATLLLLRAIERPSRRRWLWYGAVVLLLGLANLVALVGLVGHAVILALQPADRRRAAWRGFAVAVAVALVLLLPLAVAALGQTETQISWIAPPTWGTARTFGPQVFGSVPICIALGVLALIAVVVDRRRAAPLLAATLLPVLVIALVSLAGSTSYWFPRYALFLLPLAVVVAALPLARLPLPAGLAVAVGIGLLGIPPQSDLRGRAGHEISNLPYVGRFALGVDYAAAASAIAHGAQPGDGWVAPSYQSTWQLSNAMHYYLPRYLPKGREVPEALIAAGAAKIGQFYPEPMPHPTVATVPQGRLWVVAVGGANPLAKLPPADGAFIRQHYLPVRRIRPAPHTSVYLFRSRVPAR